MNFISRSVRRSAFLRVALAIALVSTGLAAPVTSAISPTATTSAPASVTRTELERSNVPGTDLETRLYLIVYPPGAAAPIHHHPVDGLGYILEGTAKSAFGTDAPVTLVAGQSFHDLPVIAHSIFANASRNKPLKFLMAYTVKKGAPVLETP